MRVQPRALESALDLLGAHLWRNRTAEGRVAQSTSPCLLAAHVAGRPLARRAHEGAVGCLQTGRGTGGRVVDTPRWTRPEAAAAGAREPPRASKRSARASALVRRWRSACRQAPAQVHPGCREAAAKLVEQVSARLVQRDA